MLAKSPLPNLNPEKLTAPTLQKLEQSLAPTLTMFGSPAARILIKKHERKCVHKSAKLEKPNATPFLKPDKPITPTLRKPGEPPEPTLRW